jgi:hypothetical protein
VGGLLQSAAKVFFSADGYVKLMVRISRPETLRRPRFFQVSNESVIRFRIVAREGSGDLRKRAHPAHWKTTGVQRP